MANRISLVRWVAACVLAGFVAACAPQIENHGYVPADAELAQIKVGDSKEAVTKTVGSPSVEGLKNADAWYYVQSRWRTLGAFAPKEVDRQVVAISFSPAGKVTNIERFGLDHGNVVTISRRVTSSTVKGMTLLQQLFNDLGRFDPTRFLKKG